MNRHLSSLTDDECREAFRIAFGYIPNHYLYTAGAVTAMRDDHVRLCIMQNGAMGANDIKTGGYTDFFAVRLIDFLRGIGIEFIT